ncbi:hypothetical protein MUK42_15737 [Musa troglodytarum]|uniref:Uncharacterized protein n=1 Tax=Musa troglodytarum TaxID=320322 RepID=A0A9E7JHY7_9LILI|nr:hypothetical protein MUK42_15737 [Musa troglodytarum]
MVGPSCMLCGVGPDRREHNTFPKIWLSGNLSGHGIRKHRPSKPSSTTCSPSTNSFLLLHHALVPKTHPWVFSSQTFMQIYTSDSLLICAL